MKRFSTAFLLLMLLGSVAFAQTKHTTTAPKVNVPVNVNPMGSAPASQVFISSGSGSMLPQATVTRAVSYSMDTSDDNWWIFAPVFTAGADSMGYLRFGSKLYLSIEDSIGDIAVNLGNGQTQTIFDTMYTRVMAQRVSVPTDLKLGTARIDSAAIALFPVNVSQNDSIFFKVVPMTDVQFYRGNTPTGIYPIPDFFATPVAIGGIKGSDMVAGDVNYLTVNFNHRSLGSRKQFGVVMYIDGPDFVTDTLGYILDANLQPPPSPLDIDTDGTLGTVTGANGQGIQMRTYQGQLDAGHQILDGNTSPSIIGGISRFFIGEPQYDATTGEYTGSNFFGNLVMTTYMSGTSTAGVDDRGPQNTLEELYPNPIASHAEIGYSIAKNGPVSLKLYNTLGNVVATYIDGVQGAGDHAVAVDASNLSNGVYYYKLQTGDFVATRTMVVAK